ncbi:MAG: DPP IV N-terminal domain-containing protein [Chthoniobacterales bacterium]
MKKTVILGLLILPLLSLVAEPTPTITVRKGEGVNLSLQAIGGSDGAAISKTLKNDLEISGWFTFVDAGKGSYAASGNASGGALEGKVTDRSGGTVLAKTYKGSARENAHHFANDIVETLTGNKGMATSKIVFASNRTGRKEIYVADYDGTNANQLTHDNVISVSPAISPDGKKVAYTGYQSGYADIYLIELSSGARNRIVKFPGTNSGAAFSPDGSHIAAMVSKDGNPELYVIPLNGIGVHRLTHTKGVESSPSWSPDGKSIVYCSDDGGSPQIYIIPSGGGTQRMLHTGFGYCTEPNWSPDGKRIAFNIRSGGSFSVAVLDIQSGSVRVVGSGENPAWGPDSRHLIYSTGSSLIILDVPTGHTTNVISGFGKVSEPDWSR